MRVALLGLMLVIACSAPTTDADAGVGGDAATGGGTTADGGRDAGPLDAGPRLDAGTPCEADPDCASGTCLSVVRDAGAVCVAHCASQRDCAPSTFCEPNREGVGLCVPTSAAHCQPCEFDNECGALTEVCVLGPGEPFTTCRIDCSLAGAAACPGDYSCTQVMLGGVTRSLCMPAAPGCQKAGGGFCDATSPALPCSTVNEAGTCTGVRTCVAGRYSACDAATPGCRSCDQAEAPGCTTKICDVAVSTPAHCGSCTNACPGAGAAFADVTCQNSSRCTFSCQGERYDADDAPGTGCERPDGPTGTHTSATAPTVASVSCYDSSTFTTTGLLPSDTRPHENPEVVGFSATTGAAPDFFKVRGTGGTFCQNDVGVTLAVTGAAQPACFKLTVFANKGTYACITDGNGRCTVTRGSGSYSDDSDLVLVVERTCAAAATLGSWTVSGHF